jgi:hypothetical protein
VELIHLRIWTAPHEYRFIFTSPIQVHNPIQVHRKEMESLRFPVRLCGNKWKEMKKKARDASHS